MVKPGGGGAYAFCGPVASLYLGLFPLDAGELNAFGPFLGFGRDVSAEFGGRNSLKTERRLRFRRPFTAAAYVGLMLSTMRSTLTI